jgi:tetratricopeptide (TPR) repeat protein
VASLSPAQIVERLGDSLTVLTAGSRSALDRQQTLRATLAWSHDLLTDPERTQFRRLAVFAGGFALEAAEQVTPGDCVTGAEVADLLGRLVDKSLVITEDGPTGYRYRLLEPMRQYAAERLEEAGEAAGLQRRHYDFYLDLAAAADPESVTAVRASSRGVRPDADHDNIRAALGWALRHEPQAALHLAVHMAPMWMDGSHYQEGSRWFAAALEAAPEPTTFRADALRALCGLKIRLGQTRDLSRLGEERVAIFRELGDQVALAHALDEAGMCEYMSARNDRAERLYDESLELAREAGSSKAAASALHSLGTLAQSRGDFDRAREVLLDSLRLLREVPATDTDPFFSVHTVGLFVAAEGAGEQPRMYFEETVQFFRRVDARHAEGYVLAGLGDVARAQGLRDAARERLNESLAQFRELRDPMGTAFALNRLGNLAGPLGEFELGREWLEEGLALRRELGDRRATGMTLGNLGILAAWSGDVARAEAIFGEALALFEESDDVPGQTGVRLNLGNVYAYAGDKERARELLEEAAVMAEQQLLFRAAGWIELRLAEMAIADNDGPRATDLIDRALGRLRPLGDRLGIARGLELDEAAAKSSLSPAREG